MNAILYGEHIMKFSSKAEALNFFKAAEGHMTVSENPVKTNLNTVILFAGILIVTGIVLYRIHLNQAATNKQVANDDFYSKHSSKPVA